MWEWSEVSCCSQTWCVTASCRTNQCGTWSRTPDDQSSPQSLQMCPSTFTHRHTHTVTHTDIRTDRQQRVTGCHCKSAVILSFPVLLYICTQTYMPHACFSTIFSTWLRGKQCGQFQWNSAVMPSHGWQWASENGSQTLVLPSNEQKLKNGYYMPIPRLLELSS